MFGGVAQTHFPFLNSYSSKYYLTLLETVGHRVPNRNMKDFTLYNAVSLEAFAATEFNENFSGRQPLQDVSVSRIFGCAAHPEDGDRVSYRNVGKPHLDAAVCPRKFHLFNIVSKFLNSPSARRTSAAHAVSVAPTKRTNGQSMGNVQKAMLVRESGSV